MSYPIPPSRRSALLGMHLAVLLAGATGLFGKLIGANAIVITFLRTSLGALTLVAIACLTGVTLRLRGAQEYLSLFLSGALLAVHWITFLHAIQLSTVAVGVLGFASFPLFVTFLEPLVFREKLRGRDLLAAAFVIGGLVLVTPEFNPRDRVTQGLLWAIASGLAYTLLSLRARSAVRRHPPLIVGLYQQAFAGVCALPLALSSFGPLSPTDLGYIFLLGIFFTGVLQWLVVSSLRVLSVQTVSVLLGLEPVYGIALAWLLLGEVPQARMLLGGAIICGTAVWVSLARSAPDRAA